MEVQFFDSYVSCSRDYQRAPNLERSFGVKDKKGREFGARAYVGHEVREAGGSGLSNWLGKRFFFSPHAMRDGKAFGAYQGHQYFDSEAERDAAVAKYFAAAEKRALKHKDRMV